MTDQVTTPEVEPAAEPLVQLPDIEPAAEPVKTPVRAWLGTSVLIVVVVIAVVVFVYLVGKQFLPAKVEVAPAVPTGINLPAETTEAAKPVRTAKKATEAKAAPAEPDAVKPEIAPKSKSAFDLKVDEFERKANDLYR